MFQIIVDSAANIPAELVKKYKIKVLSFINFVNGKEVTCFDPELSPEEERQKGHEYYDAVRQGADVKTGLISTAIFEDAFRSAMENNEDVLYFSLSKNISGNFNSARLAAEDLMHDPVNGRKIRLIGEAESKVHHSTLDQIHFHEVGSIDALVDVTGCAYLLFLLAPETILCSPVHVGNGFVHCAHGTLPVPAPATAELLKGIPFYSRNIQGELCTPTGAAVLKHFVTSFEAMPPMNVTEIGYGMGTKDFAAANCVRVFLGESSPGSNTAPSFDDSVLSISCNLDDMTGEAVGFATELLLQAGALDVYTIPIQMKKNRPGILLTCICEPKDRERLTSLFFLHTTTRGVRYQMFDRAKLTSEIETCHSAYGDIRIKKSCGYGVEKEKAEFEDLKAISAGHNYEVSLDQIRDTIVR